MFIIIIKKKQGLRLLTTDKQAINKQTADKGTNDLKKTE
jgi:hypothetical protein